MVTIKGVNFSSTLGNNKAAFGEELYNKLISQMTPEDQTVVTKTILDAEFYPLDIFVHYLEIMTKEVLGGNEDILQKGTAGVVKEQFNGVYKALLLLGSPEAFVERINTINGRYYQGINVETEMLDNKKVKARYLGFEKQHRIYEVCIAGWWETSLKMLGGKNVKVDVVTSLRNDKGYFEVMASWE